MPLHSQVTKSLRRFCVTCQGGSFVAVDSCNDQACVLYPLRHITKEPLPESVNVLRFIRRHCLLCAGGARSEVRNCEAKATCSLWSYRFGVMPSTFKRVISRQRENRQSLRLPGFE